MSAQVVFSRLSEAFIINGQIFAFTLLFGLPLGLLIAFGSMSKWTPFRFLAYRDHERGFFGALSRFRPASLLVKFVVWIVRGTPLMLQVLVIYYVPGLVFGSAWWGTGASGRLVATIAAFILNYACYFSEIFRGGIESIPVGQREAAQVLGMTRTQTFFKVTLLQVVKRIMPPMGNEVITLVKDTSLARVIANQEIIMAAQNYAASKGLIWPLFSTALYFLAAVGILTLLLAWAEKRLSYFH